MTSKIVGIIRPSRHLVSDANVHAPTGAAVFKILVSSFFTPCALVGGGMMMFQPRGTSSLSDQTRRTFVYGDGIDVPDPLWHATLSKCFERSAQLVVKRPSRAREELHQVAATRTDRRVARISLLFGLGKCGADGCRSFLFEHSSW